MQFILLTGIERYSWHIYLEEWGHNDKKEHVFGNQMM